MPKKKHETKNWQVGKNTFQEMFVSVCVCANSSTLKEKATFKIRFLMVGSNSLHFSFVSIVFMRGFLPIDGLLERLDASV
jgi:hypothetical protein